MYKILPLKNILSRSFFFFNPTFVMLTFLNCSKYHFFPLNTVFGEIIKRNHLIEEQYILESIFVIIGASRNKQYLLSF